MERSSNKRSGKDREREIVGEGEAEEAGPCSKQQSSRGTSQVRYGKVSVEQTKCKQVSSSESGNNVVR